jgi:putative membrane protein
MPNQSPGQDDPRIYFAAERTFLAWIRTGLALMGVGFAVARFGLFLRQMVLTNPHGTTLPVGSVGISVPSGVALVLLGVVVLALASFRHIRTTRRLREGTWIPGQISKEAVALALLLAVTGIIMACYLLFLH